MSNMYPLDAQPTRAMTRFIQIAHLAQETHAWVSLSSKDTRFPVREACESLLAAANACDGFKAAFGLLRMRDALNEHYDSKTNKSLRRRASYLYSECEGVYFEQLQVGRLRTGDRVADNKVVRYVAGVTPSVDDGPNAWRVLYEPSDSSESASSVCSGSYTYLVETGYARSIRNALGALDAFDAPRKPSPTSKGESVAMAEGASLRMLTSN